MIEQRRHQKNQRDFSLKERDQALRIAKDWLDFKMNSLTQMIPGDPDCDACVLARQYVRAIERISTLWEAIDKSVQLQSHYAYLLNMHDGGGRMQFTDTHAWLMRLDELEKLELTKG